MDFEEYQNRIDNYAVRLSEAVSKNPASVESLCGDRQAKYRFPGVYFISTPDDSEIVYVSRTENETVHSIISDHRSTDPSLDIKGMLRDDPYLAGELDEYMVRAVRIDENRDQEFFEFLNVS